MILIVAASLCLSTAAVYAQVTPKRDTTVRQNYEQDMVKIKSTEIPTGLRNSLNDAKYKGWENAAIYRSKSGDEYVVEMNDATTSTLRRYRFDAMGKPIND